MIAEMPNEKPKAGQLGRLRDKRLHVMQVVDKDNVIVEGYWYYTGNYNWHRYTLWLKEFSTEGIVDGEAIEPDNVFEVVGTKTYRNAAGSSNTVFVAMPVDTAEWLLREKAKKAP